MDFTLISSAREMAFDGGFRIWDGHFRRKYKEEGNGNGSVRFHTLHQQHTGLLESALHCVCFFRPSFWDGLHFPTIHGRGQDMTMSGGRASNTYAEMGLATSGAFHVCILYNQITPPTDQPSVDGH